MSDERRDDETGHALARAVGSQSVRETPYPASRVARRLERPARHGWTYALPMAAALALFVAMGAFFFTRGPQGGVATPNASASPSISTTSGPATTGPAPTPTPTAVPTANATDAALVYFARDQLPPVGAMVPGPASFRTLPAAERISARVRALWDARAPASTDLGNVFRPHTGGTSLRNVTTTISGDTATVVIDAGTWDSLSSTEGGALFDQLVYTITEEPGIRRAAVREPGKDHAVIGNGIFRDPLAREDVFGYVPLASSDRTIDSGGGGSVVPASLSAKIENLQTTTGQPVRLLIDVAPRQALPRGAPGASWLPAFVATMRETTGSSAAKYEIQMAVQGGTETTLRDQVIDVTPLRYVRVSGNNDGTTYSLGVDDARPWRVSLLPGPSGGMQLHVDIGGDPRTVNRNVAVYSPTIGQTVTGSLTISGAARVFEANVSWRVRDANGREVARGFTTATQGNSPVWGSFQTSAQLPAGLTGRATLEVFWGSPRDGTDQDVVSIPLTIR